MTIPVVIKGRDQDGKETRGVIHSRGGEPGPVVYAERHLQFDVEVHPFLNATLGTAMNQAVTFGAIGSVIHSGGTTSSAIAGTADGNTLNELVDSGGGFTAAVAVGMLAHNTTDDTYARVTAVTADTRLTFATDLFPDGNETYVINAVWAGVAVAGSWDFADSGKITLTNGNDNDQADIDADPVPEWDLDDFTALTGKIDLDTYNDAVHNFTFQLALDGVAIGNTISINDFIDTGNFAEQSFVITKAALGLSGELTNGLMIVHQRTGGGPKADVKFDDLRFETSGTPLEFRSTVELDHKFHISAIRFSLSDALNISVTNGTAPGLAHDQFMALSALTNGVLFQRVQNNVVKFALTLKQLSDFLSVQSTLQNVICDGTNTYINLQIDFPEPLILDGTTGDYLSLTIQDDLSGLIEFTANALGSIEV